MILVGICAGPTERCESIARPSVVRCLPDAQVVVLREQRSIFTAYNAILEMAMGVPSLDAVLLLHDDAELRQPDLEQVLRDSLAADVAVVGVIGSRRPSRLGWTSGSPTAGRVVDFCGPDGSEQLIEGDLGAPAEVDTVDGFFLALSPWVVRTLRFDDRRYRGFDGYSADLCAQARKHGKRVVVAPIDVVHHATDGGDHRKLAGAGYMRSNLIWKSKWRADAPRWRRWVWRIRGVLLPLEYRVRGLPWT
jgi:hypothetical protein